MDSESSSNSIESIVEEGRAHEIEMAKGIESNSTTAANDPGINLISQRDVIVTHNIDANLLDGKFTLKWVMAIIIMAFTTLLSLLGNLLPEKVFPHPKSFVLFLMVLMMAFYFAVNGLIFSEKSPDIGRACNLIALVGVVLLFTVPLWSLLPPGFNLLPWIFFTFTIGALIYQCGLRGLREQRN